jgi:hypothetical protein
MCAGLLLDSFESLFNPLDEILIVRAHGDFKFTHYMFSDCGDRRIIDWETLGTQSLFFDFLNPICPWLLHHPLTLNEKSSFLVTFSGLMARFVSKLPLPTRDKKQIRRNWKAYVAAFVVDRLCRIRRNAYDRADRDLDTARVRVLDGALLFCELMQIEL